MHFIQVRCSLNTPLERVLWSVDNSSYEARRPAACQRDPEIVLNVQHDCIERDRTGSRGQAAGRLNLNCQHAIVLYNPFPFFRIVFLR